MLDSLKSFATESYLLQVVDFKTWSRTINGVRKESLLDHIYINNLSTFDSVYYDVPAFGDHLLVIAKLSFENVNAQNTNSIIRNWSKYSKVELIATLYPMILLNCTMFLNCSAQSYWNLLETILITAIDSVAPLFMPTTSKPLKNNKGHIPLNVLSKIKKRKRLFKLDRLRNSNVHQNEIKALAKEIKSHFFYFKNE